MEVLRDKIFTSKSDVWSFGVTCWDLAAYDGEKMNSMVAWAPRVQAMTLQTAEEIYATKYATACAFDALVAGSDCAVFDFGVNSGPSRSVKTAQQIVHRITGMAWVPRKPEFRTGLAYRGP